MEQIIDFTFAPLQGLRHCFHAWEGEQDETDTEATYFVRILLGIFVAAGYLDLSHLALSSRGARVCVLAASPENLCKEKYSNYAHGSVNRCINPLRASEHTTGGAQPGT
jgi:hypothetical protein